MRGGSVLLALLFAMPFLGMLQPAFAQSNDTSNTYVVKSGDTLYSIAQRVGASVRALQTWNDLEGTDLSVGDTLRVRPPQRPDRESSTESDTSDDRSRAPLADSLPPVDPDTASASADSAQTNASETDSSAPGTSEPPADTNEPSSTDSAEEDEGIRLERPDGATWIALALRTGLTADSLWRWNDRPDTLPDEVRLPADVVEAGRHTVEEGDTFYSIAGRYGVSVRAIEAANDMDANDLRIGQELRIPGMDPTLSEAWAAPDTAQVSVFPDAFAGRLTASGMRYDPDALVGSHPSLPFNSVVLLSHPLDAPREEAQHVFVHIIDRSVDGPEISEAAAAALSLDNATDVALRVVWQAPE